MPARHKYLPDPPIGWCACHGSALLTACGEQAARLGFDPRFETDFSVQPLFLCRPCTGYALSPYPARSRTLDVGELTPEAVACYIVTNADMWRSGRHYLGGWLDRETGRFHLDVSIIVPHRCEAERLARSYKERAYFDVAKEKTIYVTSAAEHQGRALTCARTGN
jgi:hypothetical protein